MNKIEIPLSKFNRLINFSPVVLVTSALNDKNNIVTVAWVTPLSNVPPLLGIAVAKKHFTNKLIKESSEFVINIPGKELLSEVKFCGSVRGEKIDKLKESGLTAKDSKETNSPIIDECLAHLECKLSDTIDAGDHSFFIGEVVHATAVEGFLDKEYIADPAKAKTIHHLGGSRFARLEQIS